MNKIMEKLNARSLSERPFSRRTLLRGLGVGALGASVNLYTAQAQGAVPSEGPLGLERTTVGDIDVTVIKDSSLQLPPRRVWRWRSRRRCS